MVVEVPADVRAEVSAFAEVQAGWQVVGADGALRPALAVADRVLPGVPTVVVLTEAPTAPLVREHLLAGALDVLHWPVDRERLLGAPDRVGRVAPPGRGPRIVRVGGVVGASGTSTVALGVAGVFAWGGLRTLVVGEEDLLRLCGHAGWSGPGALELAGLDAESAAAELPALRRAVPAVDGLTVLGGPGRSVTSTVGWDVDLVVADVRVPQPQALERCELVVARPDLTLRDLPRGVGLDRLVVAGHGVLDEAGVRGLLGAAPALYLAGSARVARAGLLGRVPHALPGRAVRRLRRLLGAGVPRWRANGVGLSASARVAGAGA